MLSFEIDCENQSAGYKGENVVLPLVLFECHLDHVHSSEPGSRVEVMKEVN